MDTAFDTAQDAAREEVARAVAIRRASYIDGLRALADVLEEHDELDLPYDGNQSAMTLHFLTVADPRGEMAAAARIFKAAGVKWRKDASGTEGGRRAYFDMHGDLHGLKLHLTAFREAVCERVVVGTEDREVDVVVQPAVTEKVVQPVEVVEWRCHPVLAPAGTAEAVTA